MISNKAGKDLQPCKKCGDYFFKITHENCMSCR